MKSSLLASLTLLALLPLPCGANDHDSVDLEKKAVGRHLLDREIARVNGREIYLSDLDYNYNNRYTLELHNLALKLYHEQKAELEKFIDRLLLAKEAGRRGITPAELAAAVTAGAAEEAKKLESEKEELFRKFAAKMQKEYPRFSKKPPVSLPPLVAGKMVAPENGFTSPFIDEIKSKIVDMKKAEYINGKRSAFFQQLRDEAEIELYLERPELIHLDISPDDDPSLGNTDAPITIIIFADYQCPFCRTLIATLKEIFQERKSEVRLVFRDFPLSSHKQANMAAEAAECADGQGKFWEYAELLFSNQQSLNREALGNYAASIGLDSKRFNRCLDGGEQRKEVAKDRSDARAAGISSTPSTVINGFYIPGTPSMEYLEEVIASLEGGTDPRVQRDPGMG